MFFNQDCRTKKSLSAAFFDLLSGRSSSLSVGVFLAFFHALGNDRE